jgi:UDP-N-acetylglucosamine diphosphorylase/glucosamine-1-phosphate N-acetyltransferase
VTTVYLYDDAQARTFEPFASTRPVSELASGTTLIRERWLAALGADDARFVSGERHQNFDEPGAVAAEGMIPLGSIVVNARFAPALPADAIKASRRAASCSMWRSGDRLTAVRLREAVSVSALSDGSKTLEHLYAGTGAIGTLDGTWIDEVWDFIRVLPQQLEQDIEHLGSNGEFATPTHVTVLGSHGTFIALDAVVEPHVVIDVTNGPVYVGQRSHVRAFTRLVGPCFIGDDVQVMGGDISVCSIGGVCKVRGELSNSIFLGHSNKGHDGFVGHSYLGRWVNLGAGTVTSNLKNTYGAVSLWTPGGVRDTGMQFLGTLFGDHVKTGIGLRLTTGTVLGAAANVYGNMPPKAVAPFAWGDSAPYGVYRADKFLEAAARMMSRRHVELSDRARRHFEMVHASRWTVEMNEE